MGAARPPGLTAYNGDKWVLRGFPVMPDVFPTRMHWLASSSAVWRAPPWPRRTALLNRLGPASKRVVVNAQGPGHPPLNQTCGRFPLRFIDQGQPLERSAAANAGLRPRTVIMSAFLDDDDLLFPDHVATLVNALQQQRPAQIKRVAGADDRLSAQWRSRRGNGAESAFSPAKFTGAELYPDARSAV